MNYDRNILIKNIRRLMKDKDMTQNDLAQISNTQQNRVSLCLRGNGDFTIPQLMAIASYFEVSLDDLLGLKSENKKGIEDKCETYSDIFKMFFLLENFLDIKVMDIMESDIYGADPNLFPGEYDARFDTLKERAISFNDDVIINVLGEWRIALGKMKPLTGGIELYETWKQGIIAKNDFKIGSRPLNHPNNTITEQTSNIQKYDGFMNIPD